MSGPNPKRPRIRVVHFTRNELPRRAKIWTRFGWVRVEWRDVAGDWCWFATGNKKARQEALPAIEHVEQLSQIMGGP